MAEQMRLPEVMHEAAQHVARSLPEFPKLNDMFLNCLANTYATTLQREDDGSVFVITGDIPAMWLRDSAAQVKPYLRFAKRDPAFADLIAGVVKRQAQFVLLDPYANAFNAAANGHCHNRDKTDMSAWIWERKYELDSLCAPLVLAHALWRETGRTEHLSGVFADAARLIIDTVRSEQRHETSPYRFERLEGPTSDTLTRDGLGSPVGFTGMSWSGFRPSDDACQYQYLVPSNMMAVVALRGVAEVPVDDVMKRDALTLAAEIDAGIQKFGVFDHPKFGTIYAYEVDGLGQANLMDDANVPSLLSAAYLGYCSVNDPIYQATRAFVLSDANPYFYRGRAAQGIGSPHTPVDYIWPISLCIEGLTATDRDRKLALLDMLLRTDAGTGLMHEGFHKDDPTQFTRPWFAWANSLFAEFVLSLCSPEF